MVVCKNAVRQVAITCLHQPLKPSLYPLGTLNIYRLPIAIWHIKIPPLLMFANTTFMVQYPNKIMKKRPNSDTSEDSAMMTESPVPATVSLVEPIKLPIKSRVKLPCIETQNEYNRCGTTVIRLAAKKPFSTLMHVVLMLFCPDS